MYIRVRTGYQFQIEINYYKLQQYTPTNKTNPPTNVAGPGIEETDNRYPIADPMIGSKDNANVTVREDKCFMATKKPE